jgi:hypothetical protein
MRVQPSDARPRDEVELHFPEETERGVAHVLEERVGDGWQLRYYLTSATEDHSDSIRWAPVGEDYSWIDLPVGGPGPDRIVIPDTAEPGEYRVCTGNAGTNFCAEIVVVE